MSTMARTASGDLQIPRVLVTDLASVALQTIRDTLALWQGEWFLDTLAGFPWGQQVLGQKNPSLIHIENLLRKAIMFAPGVVSVDATAAFDRSARSFAYTFTARLSSGQVIVGGTGQAFQVLSGAGSA